MKMWFEKLASIYKIAKSNDLGAKKQLALDLFGLNLFLINQTPILKDSHNNERAGENGLATPAPRAHFRLYSALRLAIKNRTSCEKCGKSCDLVRLYDVARTYFTTNSKK